MPRVSVVTIPPACSTADATAVGVSTPGQSPSPIVAAEPAPGAAAASTLCDEGDPR